MATTNGLPNKRFGIKEVADVKFYSIVENGTSGAVLGKGGIYHSANPVLVLDTLKVSNIESTAEQSEARGGKGNAALIIWDYGREITVTLEDALLSMETLALMFEKNVEQGADNEIVINANTYPGTYYVEGSTYARDELTGKDDLFTFTIPKAKMQSEVTLTMEAEGDPTVFNMSLRVLRCRDGEMMFLNKAEATANYQITFKFANGYIVTIPATSETEYSSITPDNTAEYTWNPAIPTGKVTGNANYEEVASN
jgi:hypothetical protein